MDFDFCFAYIDDILIASSSKERVEHLKKIFEKLKEYGVVINPSKSVFGQSSVKFLGYLVTDTQPLPAKVNAIQSYS